MAIATISFSGPPSHPKPLNGGDSTLSLSNWNGEIKECSFRGIPFPADDVEISFSQDLAQHKKPNVAGAKIESLGRNPIEFRVRALCLNGLIRGTIDTWDNLFPETFNKLLLALFDNTAGIFVHPTLGQFNVKPMNGSTKTQHSERNGQTLEFTLIEANPPADNLISGDEIGLVADAATKLDAFLSANPMLANLGTQSISSLVNGITSTLYNARTSILQVNQQINQAVYQLNSVEVAAKSLGSTSTAIVQQNAERIKAGLYGTQNTLAQSQASLLSFYTVQTPMTLGSVANATHASPDDLVQLNPQLVAGVLVPAGTSVAYPTPTTA